MSDAPPDPAVRLQSGGRGRLIPAVFQAGKLRAVGGLIKPTPAEVSENRWNKDWKFPGVGYGLMVLTRKEAANETWLEQFEAHRVGE